MHIGKFCRSTSTTIGATNGNPAHRRRGVAAEGLVDLREALANDADGRFRQVGRGLSLKRLPRRNSDAARREQRVRL